MSSHGVPPRRLRPGLGTWYVNGRTNDPIIAAVLDVRSGTGAYEGVDGYALFGYEVDHFYLTMYLTDPARE